MTMPLMTHTLPTVVGMGVVSRTTEVMFDKKGKKRKPTKRTVSRRPATKRAVPKKKLLRRTTKSYKVTVTRKPAPRKVVAHKLPPGDWMRVSPTEMLEAVGKAKLEKVKNAGGKVVKVGMYDKAVYIGGKYYLSI